MSDTAFYSFVVGACALIIGIAFLGSLLTVEHTSPFDNMTPAQIVEFVSTYCGKDGCQ